jgi:ABC-type branched-subunit amino acid transport system substrate-binding protein
MSIDALTSSTGAAFPQNIAAAKAAAASINAQGGIQGHPLVVTTCDTQLTAAGEQACATTLDTSQAVAVISDGSSLTTSIVDTTVKDKIASIGVKGYGSSNYLAASTSQFPINNGAEALFVCPEGLKAAGASKVGGVIVNAAVGDVITQGLQAVITHIPGVSYTGRVSVELSATDYAAPLQTAINNGSTGVVSALASPGVDAMMQADNGRVKICSGLGTPPDSDLISLGSAANGYVAMSSLPPLNLIKNTADGKQFFADLAAYQKSSGDPAAAASQQDDGSLNAWLAVRAFQQVADKVSGPITRQAIFNGFTNLTDLNFPGILPHPINYTKTTPIPTLARLFLADYKAYVWSATTKSWSPLGDQSYNVINLLTGS